MLPKPALLLRLLGMLLTLLMVVGLVFMLIHLIPGDPVEALLGEHASPVDREALRTALGLNLPLGEQFMNFAGGLLRGDWGNSMVSGKPVLAMLGERLPATLELTVFAMGFAVLAGLGLGVWQGSVAARFPGSASPGWRALWSERGLDLVSLVMMVVPTFVVGPLLIVVVSVGLGWLPVSGNEGLSSVILPAMTLGMGLAAVLARMLAAGVRQQVGADYVRTALAKGLTPRGALYRHALRNALLPLVQVFFLQLGMVLTGAVLTEAVFGWPGLGNLLVDALHQRDYPVIQGCLLLISLTYMVCLILADMVSLLVDPRLRGRA